MTEIEKNNQVSNEKPQNNTSSCCPECLGECNGTAADEAEIEEQSTEQDEMLEITKRLAKEQLECGKEYFRLGYSDAQKWAKTASYKAILNRLYTFDCQSLAGTYLSEPTEVEYEIGWYEGLDHFVKDVFEKSQRNGLFFKEISTTDAPFILARLKSS